MLTASIVQSFKQNNISVNEEKVKARLRSIWMQASKAEREKIMKLSGIKNQSVARAYKTGHISLKLVAPVAEVVNVNPYYLTGEVEEPGQCSSELIRQIAAQHGYVLDGYVDAKEQEAAQALSNAWMDEISEDDMVVLLRATMLKAKAGGKSEETLKQIKKLLVD